MSKNFVTVLAVLLAALLILLYASLFTVQEGQTAVRFQFGEIVQANYKPGLHFKLPLVNTIRKFDARVQTLDTDPEQFLTSEKKNVLVDSFVKWRIEDAKRFYTAVAGNPARANLRLDQIIKDNLRSEFSKRTVKDVVSGDRVQIMEILTETATEEASKLGIGIVDVRIKRVDLPDDVSESVYARMRAERERVARDFRSRGKEAAERIRADADRQRTITLAEAYRDAETKRGEGDAISADVYARAYNKDAEFFRLYRSLNAYRSSFNQDGDILVLQPEDSDFFNYFKRMNGRGNPSSGADDSSSSNSNNGDVTDENIAGTAAGSADSATEPGNNVAEPGNNAAEPGNNVAEPGNNATEPGNNVAESGNSTAERSNTTAGDAANVSRANSSDSANRLNGLNNSQQQ
jgi:membrane protease subunit HflC